MRKIITLLTLVSVLWMSASGAYSQNSTGSTQTKREQYIAKTERAIAEVLRSREYITELETTLATVETQIAEMEKAGAATEEKLLAREAEAKELRTAIEFLKVANGERLKAIVKLQQKVMKLEGQVSFWKKVAAISAAIAAGVILLK